MDILLYVIIFLYGIVIGSFLNVCILRIPLKETIITERSHCMNCGSVLKWYELIPLFSFLFQRGRCRHCKCRISIQYPIVEFANGCIYVLVFAVNGMEVTSILFALGASALLALSVIDARTQEIPFGFNVFLFVLGAVRMVLDLTHWYVYVIGFFAVSVFFLLIILITRGRGLGGGDCKLMAGAGMLLGWQDIILAMVLGCILGVFIHVPLMKWGHKDRVLSFGPYLSAGIFISMLWGGQIISWYLSCF